MSEPGRKGGIKTATVRIKTPQEIESQYRRLNLSNWVNRNNADFDSAWVRDRAITRAARNARQRAGYEATGVVTRNGDSIFRNTSNGRYFTVQGDRIVNYRGNRVRRY